MADKLISQLTPAAATFQDIDLVEVQVSGEVFSRKFTGLKLRAIEKLERETQDNVIEAGAGLNANGTFTAPATSFYLKAADYAAGCVDMGGATGALTENIVNGLRLLDAKFATIVTGTPVVLVANLNSDTTLTNIIPAGYMLEYVIFNEKAAGSPILDLGTTVGGNEIFIGQALTPSGVIGNLIVCPNIFSLVANKTLYLNHAAAGSTWGGGTVDVYFVMKQIV